MLRRRFIGVVAATLLSATPALAHHAFSADFDSAKPIRLDGTVTRIEWTNPHAYLYLEVKDAHGKATSWKVELGGNDALDRQIWSPTLLKAGHDVTMQGWQAKNGSRFANADSVTIAGGVRLWAASSYHSDNQHTGVLARSEALPRPEGTVGKLPRPEGTVGELPRTASPLALIGLIGLLSTAAAAGLRASRR